MWVKLAFLIVSCIVLVQQSSACSGEDTSVGSGEDKSIIGPIGPGCYPNLYKMKKFCYYYPKHPKCSCYKAWMTYCTPYHKHPLCQCCKWCKWF